MNKSPTLQWALITGASAGIGHAFARKVAERGYNVVLVARRLDILSKFCDTLTQEFNINAIALQIDLRAPTAVALIMEELSKRSISIDLLFNNAGYGTNGSFHDLDVQRELRMIDLNCRTLVELSYFVSRGMIQKGRGIIIHTASVIAFAPAPYYAVYGATKSFVLAFSEALGEELRSTGVRVYTLCPGSTASEFQTVANFKGFSSRHNTQETAAKVANICMKALDKNTSLIISGIHNKLIVFFTRLMPRALLLRWTSKILRPQN